MEGIGIWVVEWSACGLFAASVVSDLRHRRIPNGLPVLLLGLFAAYVLVGGIRPLSAIWVHLAIGTILLACGFSLFLTGRFGAGDGKLLAAAGVWTGPADLPLYLFCLGGASLALSMFALLPFERTRCLRTELPFALAIAPPAIIVMISRFLSHNL